MRRRQLSRTAAGHASRGEDNILLDISEEDGCPVAILKRLDEVEFRNYDRLWNSYEDDPIHAFVPRLEGIVEVLDELGNKKQYLKMSNLLRTFRQPKVMDVKLGTRTFLEAECENGKLRPDLLKRMLAMYPTQVTDEDRSKGGVTKLRWMKLRDDISTIRNLGFRIDGIAGYRRIRKGDLDAELTRVKSRGEVRNVFCNFVRVAATDDGQEPNAANPVQLARQLLEQLKQFRDAFSRSAFVREHECIGTSILLIADAYGKTGAFWIDFGKTQSLPDGFRISHDQPWAVGNHEDGVMTGVDSMVSIWEEVVNLIATENHVGTGSLARSRSWSVWAPGRSVPNSLIGLGTSRSRGKSILGLPEDVRESNEDSAGAGSFVADSVRTMDYANSVWTRNGSRSEQDFLTQFQNQVDSQSSRKERMSRGVASCMGGISARLCGKGR